MLFDFLSLLIITQYLARGITGSGSRQWFSGKANLQTLRSFRTDVVICATTVAELGYTRTGRLEACRLSETRDITELQWLVSRLALSTREANLDEMLSLIELCGMLEVSNIVRNTSNFHTYPGTLWCGPGDSASSYSELGANTAVDRCCRNHDFCPVRASPGEITVPVVWGKEHSGESVNLFTVSHCHCDKVFKRCLHEAGTTERVTARAMIFLYEAAIRQCIGDNGQLVEQHVNLWDLF